MIEEAVEFGPTFFLWGDFLKKELLCKKKAPKVAKRPSEYVDKHSPTHFQLYFIRLLVVFVQNSKTVLTPT